MEILIFICLLIIIYLMVQDKFNHPQKKSETSEIKEKFSTKISIMGKSRTVVSQLMPKSSTESQKSDIEIDPSNLDIEFDENESLNDQILSEEPEKDSSSQLDFSEEEEEWNKYRIVSEDNGLAQGVTYEELSNVEMMLQLDTLESFQKETAIVTVQKIYGTELHTLLENSIENASQKIAELLDNSIYAKENGSSILQNDHPNPFNIDAHIV